MAQSNITKNLLALGLMALCSVPQAMAVGILDLAALETRFFAHPYEKESVAERLNRLEDRVFGEPQTGSTEDRIARLDEAIKIKETILPPLGTAAPFSSSRQPQADEVMKSPQPHDEVMKSPATQPRQHMVGGSSTYPAVTALEQSILGKTFYTETVQQRLDRLETKAYGKPTQIQDLATRVDKLNSYANVYGMHDVSDPLANVVGSSQPQPAISDNGIIDRVAALEKTMYGQVSSEPGLLQRVDGLEQSVFGASTAWSGAPLRDRVNRLWVSVKRTQTAPPAVQTAQGLTPFSSSASPTDWNSQNSPVSMSTSQHQKHHSFLSKIGKAVVLAGSAAISAGAMAAGSMGGGYGYGTGYGGYGGFSSFMPYGFGNMGSFGGIRTYGNGISNAYAMMQAPRSYYTP